MMGSVGKLATLHHAALCWALLVPTKMCGAVLYLLADTTLLQGHIIKQQTWYFGQLEFGLT